MIATHVESRLTEVGRDIWEYLTAEMPQLTGDDIVGRILRASVEENVATLLHIFEHDIPLEDLEGPTAASEYARRLAQRDVPLSMLIRAYRVGHWRFLQWCLDEADRRDADDRLSAAVNRRMLRVSFGYIDRITERVVEVHQLERDRWLLSRTAVRAARVRDILDEEQIGLDSAETALGYRLRQNHLGLVAWLPALTRGGTGLARLDRHIHEIAEELDCPAGPLFVPRDEVVAWAWLPFGSHNEVSWGQLSRAVEDGDPSVRVCAGSVQRGVEGFRRTNRRRCAHRSLRRPRVRATGSPRIPRLLRSR
ncbi:hypothetical protein ACFQ0G_08835 [Streptomyces chiangmaiensis]